MKWITLGALAALVIASGAAQAQDKKDDPNKSSVYGYGGLAVGGYFPSDSKVRDALGDSVVSWGLGFVNNRYEQKWLLKPDFTLLSASKDGNDLLIITGTVGYERSFADASNESIPYVRGGIGLAYLDYDLTTNTYHADASRLTGTANVEAGIILSDKVKLWSRYSWFGESDGLQFGGLEVGLVFGFFKVK